MSLLTNPVLVSVVVLCVLCLLKLNVLMSLIIAAMTGAVLGGISIPDAMGILCDGFSGNAPADHRCLRALVQSGGVVAGLPGGARL